MSAPKTLFLQWNDIDGQFHVNDKKGFAFGSGSFEPRDSIASARVVSDAPIHMGLTDSGIPKVSVSSKPNNAEADPEEFIATLAEIGGMKVQKLYNDNLEFIGYTMEVRE